MDVKDVGAKVLQGPAQGTAKPGADRREQHFGENRYASHLDARPVRIGVFPGAVNDDPALDALTVQGMCQIGREHLDSAGTWRVELSHVEGAHGV